MIVFWLLLAFVAGAMAWHKLGWWGMRKVFNSDQQWIPMNDVIRKLDDQFLRRLANLSATEVERRRSIYNEGDE